MKIEKKFSDRVRFNWGYHDGANEFLHGIRRDVKPDNPSGKPYIAAHAMGRRDAQEGNYNPQTATSDNAWEEYRVSVKSIRERIYGLR